MKARAIFIVLNIAFSLEILAQNQIRNGSFESGTYPSSQTGYYNYNNGLDYWEEDSYVGESPTWHSPDWWNEDDQPNMWPYDGEYIAAMYEWELIEQELTSSNKLIANQPYQFSVFVQPWQLTSYEDYVLKFYLANTKMGYKSHLFCDFCDADYKRINTEPKKTIKELDLGPYPNEQWSELTFTFVPSIDYDWFGMELIYAGDYYSANCKSRYVLIDKVSITETNSCATCYRTDGPLLASGPFTYQSSSGPFAVTFLDNMESATNIVIKDIWGNTIKTLPNVYSVNGLYNPIFWDGTNSASIQVAPGSYIWQMTLTNECGTFQYSEVFTKLTSVTESIPVFPDYELIRTPSPCCTALPNILINYDLDGNGYLEFIAVDSITLQNMTVESSIDSLILQAGNSIAFLPGTIIEQGVVVKAMIQPCSED